MPSILQTIKTYTVMKVAPVSFVINQELLWGQQIIWICVNVDMQATFVWR